MGPLGTQEMIAIFILALLLFGPKELPKLGKTIGKAMTEFRRAQGELKATINREMENLERESGAKEVIASAVGDASYTYDNYEFEGDDSDPYHTPYESSASATEGAETEAAPLQIEGAAESVPQGHVQEAAVHEQEGYGDYGDYHPAAAYEEPAAPAHTEAHEAVPETSGHVHG